MLNLPPPLRIANAAAVLNGPHGAVTQRACQQGLSRQALYRDTQRILQALDGQHAAQQIQGLHDQITQLRRCLKELQAVLDTAVFLDQDGLAAFASTAQAEGVNRVEVIDRNGRRRTFDYDALDRPVRESWWDGATSLRVIASAYDSVGNLTTASDPDSSYTLTYDALGRLTASDNAGTPHLPRVVLTSTYDGAGNRVEVRDNAGVTVRSAYDPRGLLASRTWEGGGLSPARLDFLYDARQDNVATTRFSDLQGTQKIGGSIAAYDALGRVARLRHRDAVDALMADYQYAYDAASQLATEVRNGEPLSYG